MPDKPRWTETDLVIRLLQAPAHIHIIARDAELRIESADGLETIFADCHIAAGDMFRNRI